MSLNVLVTAASRRVALVRAFQRALTDTGIGGRVVVTDVNPLSPAVHVTDRAYSVPAVDDVAYGDHIRAICRSEAIGLVVPTIDDELPLFGAIRRDLEAMGVRVAVSPKATSDLCNDKYASCRYLRRHGVSAARSFLPSHLPADLPLPLFIKPRRGRGGVGAVAARNAQELRFFVGYVQDPIVQEYLDGPEFTIDVLCGFDGRVLSIVPRQRIVIRSGVSDRGRTVRDERLIDLALACARVLDFAGAVNIQCRIVNDRPVVFEINPRFSGGIPLTIASGADFPRTLVELAAGRAVAPAVGAYTADVWMTHFEDSIFLQQALPAMCSADLRVAPALTGEVREVA